MYMYEDNLYAENNAEIVLNMFKVVLNVWNLELHDHILMNGGPKLNDFSWLLSDQCRLSPM